MDGRARRLPLAGRARVGAAAGARNRTFGAVKKPGTALAPAGVPGPLWRVARALRGA